MIINKGRIIVGLDIRIEGRIIRKKGIKKRINNL